MTAWNRSGSSLCALLLLLSASCKPISENRDMSPDTDNNDKLLSSNLLNLKPSPSPSSTASARPGAGDDNDVWVQEGDVNVTVIVNTGNNSQGGPKTAPPTLPNTGPAMRQAYCAGAMPKKKARSGRTVYILSSLAEAQACATKIALGGKYSKSERCRELAAYGTCDAQGLPIPWGVTPDDPTGRPGIPACECLCDIKKLSAPGFPTWQRAVPYDQLF